MNNIISMKILQSFILLLIIIYGIVIFIYSSKIDDDLQSTECVNTQLKTANKILLTTVPSLLILTIFAS